MTAAACRSARCARASPARRWCASRVSPTATRRKRSRAASCSCRATALPAPEADEFYHADLVGLAVEDTSDTALGRVRALHNFGAGDVMEIETPTGATEFIPFNVGAEGGAPHPHRDRAAKLRTEQGGVIMWRASVLTLFPEMFPGPLGVSLIGKALDERALVARCPRHPRPRHRQAPDAWTTRPRAAVPAW